MSTTCPLCWKIQNDAQQWRQTSLSFALILENVKKLNETHVTTKPIVDKLSK